MKVITSLDNIEINYNRTGVALGTFDGMHIGHQALIVNLVDICKKNNFKSVVYTFSTHPRNLTTSCGAPKRIISDQKKRNLLKELGVDYLVSVEFNNYQRTLSPEKFVKEILKEKLKMCYGIVGLDYRFGYQAKGDASFLDRLKHKYFYDLMVIKTIKMQDEVISSTRIRDLISSGNILKANLFLGRKYSLMGNVIHGKGLGKKFGFATANISVDSDLVLPSSGVYFTKCIIENKLYYSITNVGHNPTLGENTISIETHILNFNKDIYHQPIEIIFYQKLRDEMKCPTIDALIQQVNRDIQSCEKYFEI
jgi:riboflavin kinase/FMN adenylyltransferase